LHKSVDNINSEVKQLDQQKKLIANTEKTKLMLFTSRLNNDLLPDIYFRGGKREWVQSKKYSGATIDSNLKFNFHFNGIINEL